jgi:transcription elongation factor Elf1
MAETLTREQLLPFLVAEEHRRRQQQRGQTILITSYSSCPDCGGPADSITSEHDLCSLVVGQDVVISPCGHRFFIPEHLLIETVDEVQRIVDAEENNRAASPRVEPPMEQPTAAVIEIIERGATTDDTTGGSVVMPNEIRINGHPVASPADKPVIVHEMAVTGDELVQVTLTLFARRVSIRAGGDQS